jgi:hypothetical protein
MSIILKSSQFRQRRLLRGFGALIIVLMVTGCGASDSRESNAVEPPARPSAADCGFRAKASRAHGKEKEASASTALPIAGVYRYAMNGAQAVPGSGVRVKNLPSHSELFVTPPRRYEDLTCFTVQKRYALDIANTATYVIRDRSVYLIRLRIQALGESQEIRPNPPILSVSNKGSSWSGQFGGSTYGSYDFSGLGKRTFRVGSRLLPAVGISSLVSYRGVVNGTQKTTTWISLHHNVVLAESVKSKQNFGVSSLHLRSHSQLISLQPGQLPNHE